LEKRPFLLGREFENLFKTEPELMRPICLKLYEPGEARVDRAEVPGFTEKLEIKPEGVKAILKNGILEITLPKAEVVKKVKIEVKPF
jgi:hypothetical protein